jgi:hypothetical protein
MGIHLERLAWEARRLTLIREKGGNTDKGKGRVPEGKSIGKPREDQNSNHPPSRTNWELVAQGACRVLSSIESGRHWRGGQGEDSKVLLRAWRALRWCASQEEVKKADCRMHSSPCNCRVRLC